MTFLIPKPVVITVVVWVLWGDPSAELGKQGENAMPKINNLNRRNLPAHSGRQWAQRLCLAGLMATAAVGMARADLGDALGGAVGAVGDAVGGAVGGIGDAVGGGLGDAVGGIGDSVGDTVGDVGGAVGGAVGDVGDALNGADNGGVGGVGDAVGGLLGDNPLGNGVDDLVDGVGTVLNGGVEVLPPEPPRPPEPPQPPTERTEPRDENGFLTRTGGLFGMGRLGGDTRCEAGGNSDAFNGFMAMTSNGVSVGVIHDAIVDSDLSITSVRFLSNGSLGPSGCVSVGGGSFSVSGNSVMMPLSQSDIASAIAR